MSVFIIKKGSNARSLKSHGKNNNDNDNMTDER